jgi:hypothetical protein
MYISILKCGPGLLFIGLRWPSVQVEFDMPDVDLPPLVSVEATEGCIPIGNSEFKTLHKAKPDIGNIRGLNLAAVKHI